MAINAYLIFDGNCKEALAYYAQVFATEAYEVQTFKEGGVPNLNEEQSELIMHGRLRIADDEVMFSDNFPGGPFTVGNNITLAFVHTDEKYIRDSFTALSADGKITMPLQKTMWSECYGSLVDRFGIEWQFNKLA